MVIYNFVFSVSISDDSSCTSDFACLLRVTTLQFYVGRTFIELL